MKRLMLLFTWALILTVASGCIAGSVPTPLPSTPTTVPQMVVVTRVVTPTPQIVIVTATPEPTNTPTNTPTATPTNTPTATPTNTPTATPTTYPTPNRDNVTTHVGVLPPPAGMTITYDKGVGQDQQEAAQTGLVMAYRYLGDIGIKNVIIMEDLDKLAQEYARILSVSDTHPTVLSAKNLLASGRAQAVFTYNMVMLIRLDNNWRQQSRESRWGALVHEYYHGVQMYLSKRASAVPAWLVEGSARYVENRFLIDLGVRDRQRVHDAVVTSTRGLVSPLESIVDYESAPEDYGAPYALGYLAVEYLVQKYGEDRVLSAFWQNRADSTTGLAFEKTFGQTLSSFYQEFELYRQQNFPSYCTKEDYSSNQVGIRTVARFASGTPAYNALGLAQNSTDVAYVFCAQGFTHPNGALRMFSVNDLHWSEHWLMSCGGNCVIIFVKPGAKSKWYNVAVRAPDGRWGRTSFLHER